MYLWHEKILRPNSCSGNCCQATALINVAKNWTQKRAGTLRMLQVN